MSDDDLVKWMNDARDFPANTCGASRHAAMMAEALCKREDYPMLVEEPEHCGGSIAATVAALWECRTKLARAVEALKRVELSTDTRKQGAIAMAALAALKGETDA
jgi:hypothetical protein